MPRPEWVIPGVARRGEVALLHGHPGCGKSTLAIDIACSVAGGIHHSLAAAAYHRPQRVLVIAGEGGGADFVERVHAWFESSEDRAQVAEIVGAHLVVATQPVDVADEQGRLALVQEALKAFNGEIPDLIVVDTVSACATSIDENSSTDVAGMIGGLRRAFATPSPEEPEPGPLWLLIHHQPKGVKNGSASPRGSGAWRGNVDLELEVVRKGDELEVRQRKGNRIAGLEDKHFTLTTYDFGQVDEFGVRATAPFTVPLSREAPGNADLAERQVSCCEAFRRILEETFTAEEPPTTRAFRAYLQENRGELSVSGRDWDRFHKVAIEDGYVLRERKGRALYLRPRPGPGPTPPGT